MALLIHSYRVDNPGGEMWQYITDKDGNDNACFLDLNGVILITVKIAFYEKDKPIYGAAIMGYTDDADLAYESGFRDLLAGQTWAASKVKKILQQTLKDAKALDFTR